MSDELVERVAIAIRQNKFERNGRLGCFDPSNISGEERSEAAAAISVVIDECARVAERTASPATVAAIRAIAKTEEE